MGVGDAELNKQRKARCIKKRVNESGGHGQGSGRVARSESMFSMTNQPGGGSPEPHSLVFQRLLCQQHVSRHNTSNTP